MPRAYLRASGSKHVPYLRATGSKHVPMWQVSLLGALVAAFLSFSPAAWGERPARALLGDPTVESRQVSLPGGRIEAFRVHAHASGRAATLLVFLDARSTAAKVVVGLYRNLHGRPGGLLGTGAVEAPRAGAWNGASLSRVPRLVSGRSYWLTVLGKGGTLRYRARVHGRCLGETEVKAHLSALPDTWSAGRTVRHAHCPISAYAIAGSLSSALPFLTAPRSPRSEGAPVNLTPPTIAVQAGAGSSAPQSLAPFSQPVEQMPPTEEQPKQKSPQEKPAKEPAPHNSALPAVGGTLTVGEILSTTRGTWSGSPTSYGYQWQDCNSSGASCSNIAGASSSAYTLSVGDVGHTVRGVVTATNAGGSTPATSAPTGVIAAYSSGSPYPACTQTISQGANVASTVSGAAAGSVICLSSGAYGSLTLNASHSSDVTLQAALKAHVTADKVVLEGSHIVVRGLWIDGEVALEEGASYMTIDRDDITGGGEGIVFDTSDCTVPNAPTWSGCEPHKPISNVIVSSNHIHNIGENGTEDAIHLDNWRNVTVTGNEFEHINESGNHTDCLQSVYGGEGLVFTHNYEHDNDCQGIFIEGRRRDQRIVHRQPVPTRSGRLLRQLRPDLERGGLDDSAQHDLGRQGLRVGCQRCVVHADCHDRPQRDQHLQSGKTDRQPFRDHRGRGHLRRIAHQHERGPRRQRSLQSQIRKHRYRRLPPGQQPERDRHRLGALRTGLRPRRLSPSRIARHGVAPPLGLMLRQVWAPPAVAISLLALTALLLQACSGSTATSASRGLQASGQVGGSMPSGQVVGSMPAGLSGSAAAVRCDTSVTKLAQAEQAVAKAAPGKTVCLEAGTYVGKLSLAAKPAGYVTLTAAPGAHVNTGSIAISGSHLAVSDLWIHGDVALAAGASDIAIVHDDISNVGGAGGEGIVFETSDCTAPNAPKWQGCEAHAPISGVAILANRIHDIGSGASEDAIHLDDWRDVRIEGNELEHIVESGNHTDCLQSVYGGEGLVFAHNYEHDNDCQGIFIKDGDATNVSFTENLFVRDQVGSYANFSQIWNVKGLTIEHNTIWDGKGLALVADEASFQPTATVERNLIGTFTLEKPTGTSYAMVEQANIFGQAPWSFKPSRSDRTMAHPRFVAPSRGDYRLLHNRRGVGVDWSPATQAYGPIS